MSEFAFIPGESFNGAVARWADEIGGLERMSELTAIAGVQYGHRQQAAFSDPDQIAALADAMEVDPAELLVRATPRFTVAAGHHRHAFFGTSVPTLLLEKRFRRFSPASLALSPHDRALWSIRLLPFCSESWEVLVEKCPYCGKRPGWQHTLGVSNCEGECMTDLRTARTRTVPQDIRPALEAVVGLVHPDPVRRVDTIALLPPVLADAGPAASLDLLVRLIPVVDPAMPTKVTELIKVDPLLLCGAIARTWEVVTGWPDALNALASRRIATRTTRHTDGNGGRTLRFVSPKRGSEIPPLVVPLVEAWRETVDLQGPRGPGILAATRSITDVARTMGLGSADVGAIRRQGAIGTVFVLDGGRAEPRLDVSDFAAIHRLMEARTPIHRARLGLGVSCHGVEQMVAMRLVRQERHPFIVARYEEMQIVASTVTALEGKVSETVCGEPKLCTVSLHEAMKSVGGRLKPWGPAFAALVARRLDHVVRPGPGPLSRRVMIPPSMVPVVAALEFDQSDPTHLPVAYSPTMSKIDAGEALNLGFSQSIPLLGAIPTKTGTREKLVPITYVLAMARMHISTTELSARRGLSKQRAYWDAVKAGIPDLGPGGFCRVAAEERYFA